MTRQGRLTQEASKIVNSNESSAESKRRPQHCECKYSQDGLCMNRASMFFGEVREAEARVCSTFQRREA